MEGKFGLKFQGETNTGYLVKFPRLNWPENVYSCYFFGHFPPLFYTVEKMCEILLENGLYGGPGISLNCLSTFKIIWQAFKIS